jgi:hypothetical protein
VLEESVGRSNPEGDVEQDVGRRRLSASRSCAVDDHANLLVAWPSQAELLGNHPDAPVCLSDRRVASVYSFCGSNEARIDARREAKHRPNDAAARVTEVQRNGATLSK